MSDNSDSILNISPLNRRNNDILLNRRNNDILNIFKQNTNLGYVYVPFNSTSLYNEAEKKQNIITLHEKLDIYDNSVISINNIVKTYFGYEDDVKIPMAPTITQYIKWLHTIYVINKDIYLPPF